MYGGYIMEDNQMADEKFMPDDEFEADVYTLTDESGKESQFELIGTTEYQGVTYMAMTPIEDDSGEYVILKMVKDEDGENILETIDDDDEFDRVADIFDDMLFSEEDYDK